MLNLSQEIVAEFPPFEAHPLLWGKHVQTLVSLYFDGYRRPLTPKVHHVELDDGDVVVLHDDQPESWRPGDAMVLLVHGLGGCHMSNYMVRLASRFVDAGIRVFRMDQRGCGAGLTLSKQCYHAGRSEDAQAAVEFVLKLCPVSPLQVAGLSLGGNVVLRMLGLWGDKVPQRVVAAFAAAPPICLHSCNTHITRQNRYDGACRRWIIQHAIQRKKFIPPEIFDTLKAIKSLSEFDEQFVAPLAGFRSAEHYYEVASSKQHVAEIVVPTLVIAADNDPLIPIEIFAELPQNPAVVFHKTNGGGHIGFIGKTGRDADRRWLDWRLLQWVEANHAEAAQSRQILPTASNTSVVHAGVAADSHVA